MVSRTASIFLVSAVLFSPMLGARENSSLLYQKGAALARAGKIKDSVVLFQRVVALSPWYCLGHYGLGKAYLHQERKNSDAIKHLKKATELDRTYAPAHFYLGFAYLLGGKKLKAIHSFQRAYTIDEEYIESLFNIGVIYDLMGAPLKSHLYFRRYFLEKEKEEDEIF